MSRGARLLSAIARALWGLAAVALVAGVVVLSPTLPDAPAEPVSPVLVDVPPGSTVLVCPGTVRLPTEPEDGDDVAYDPQFDAAPGESVAALGVLTARPSSDPAARALLTTLAGEQLDQVTPARTAGGGWFDGPEAATVLRADATGEQPPWLAGSMRVVTAEGDLRGLAAATCQYPTAESWLVGGGTELGSSARLVLANPGVTPASVTVRVWGPSGEAELAGAPEYLVPPGSERVVLLEGVAAQQRRIVVQTTSSGGAIAAFLQDSLLRGFVSAGIDHVVAGQGPATRQVVPLSVTSSEADGLDVAQLRVLAPGEEAGTADVTFIGADGPVDLPGTQVALDPGVVIDIPLGGLPAGEYVAVVEADVPVVAGGMLTRGQGVGDTRTPAAPMDRAWAASVSVGSGGPLALPSGAAGVLVLAVPDNTRGGTAVVVEAVGPEGVLAAREYRVRGGRTLSIPLDDLTAEAADGGSGDELVGLVVRPTDRVAWAVVLLVDGEMVGVLTPVDPRPAAPQLGVHVR
jgi:hypothetical protein